MLLIIANKNCFGRHSPGLSVAKILINVMRVDKIYIKVSYYISLRID